MLLQVTIQLLPCMRRCQQGSYACSEQHKEEMDHFLGSHNEDLKTSLSSDTLTVGGCHELYEMAFQISKMENAKLAMQQREREKAVVRQLLASNTDFYSPGRSSSTQGGPPRLTMAQRIRQGSLVSTKALPCGSGAETSSALDSAATHAVTVTHTVEEPDADAEGTLQGAGPRKKQKGASGGPAEGVKTNGRLRGTGTGSGH